MCNSSAYNKLRSPSELWELWAVPGLFLGCSWAVPSHSLFRRSARLSAPLLTWPDPYVAKFAQYRNSVDRTLQSLTIIKQPWDSVAWLLKKNPMPVIVIKIKPILIFSRASENCNPWWWSMRFNSFLQTQRSDLETGKTSLLNVFTRGFFPEAYEPTDFENCRHIVWLVLTQ